MSETKHEVITEYKLVDGDWYRQTVNQNGYVYQDWVIVPPDALPEDQEEI